jgi:hypothetical protein
MMKHFLDLIAVVTIACLCGNFCFGQAKMTPEGNNTGLPKCVSQDWWSTARQNIQKEEYNFSSAAAETRSLYQAPNRAHGFRACFTEKGISLLPLEENGRPWEWGLEVISKAECGRRKAEVTAKNNRIEYIRDNITEWYVNDEKGLEQGFTVIRPLDNKNPGKLNVDMKLKGNLRPKFTNGSGTVDFYPPGGDKKVLSYGQLKVTDANGKRLPSKFEKVRGGLRIAVDATGAKYPIDIDPLATTPAWIGAGNKVYAFFGYSVAGAGDVNGDGYSDIIVGAYYYTNGQNYEGAAFVYYGSPSGLSTTPNWSAEGNQAGASFGWYVSGAGDVNHDGYDDVIVGAPYYDNGQTDEGAAFVYLGSASGLSTTANWTGEGNQVRAYFGYSVAGAGDVNDDNYSDVIVGAAGYDNGQNEEGAAYAYYGSSSGLPSTPSWAMEGNQNGIYLGLSVAGAGDVNDDGYSDVIVAAPYYTDAQPGGGTAFLYYGSSSGLSTTAGWMAAKNENNAFLGGSVAGAGDVNGDGYADVIVGDCFYLNMGAAYVYLGSASGLSATPCWTGQGNQSGEYFGYSVAGCGDVDGSGYSEIIVGSPYHTNGQTKEGAAFVYFGTASGPSNTAGWTAEGNQEQVNYGYSVAGAGDVNGDGYADVIVGAPYYTALNYLEGTAYVYLGSAISAPSSLPNNTAVDPSICVDTGVDVSWAMDPGEWGDGAVGTRTYSVLRDGSPIQAGIAYGTTAYTDTDGVNGTSYAYSVRYINAYGLFADTGGIAAMDAYVTCANPSGLTNNTAQDVDQCVDTGVVVTWTADPSDWGDAGAGTRSYSVLRDGTAIQPGIAYGTTVYTDTTGTNGTSYTYAVRYMNGAGLSSDTAGAQASDLVITPSPLWQALGSGAGSDVNALTISGTNLYAGGHFNYIGGVTANSIARWDGTQWSAIGTGTNTDVNAIAVAGTDLYAGGAFSTAGGVTANYIAKWNGSTWSPLGSGMNGQVKALAFVGTNLYAGGQFASAGGVTVNNIARWNGSTWSALGSGMNGTVYALATDGTNLYAGGGFTTAGGVAVNNIARWDGSQWNALGSGVSSYVTALVWDGTNLYAGGYFGTAGGVSAFYVAKWNGSQWSACGSGPGGIVLALAWDGGTNLYAGGQFIGSGVEGTMSRIARWDGAQWHALGSGINLFVNALASNGTSLYAGGTFTTAGGNPASRVAKWGSPLGAPSVADIDGCAVSGVSVTWGTVAYAGGYDLKIDGTTTLPDVTSPYIYLPGDANSHTYGVRAKNVCGDWGWSDGRAGTDADNTPTTAPVLASVTDIDPLAPTGVSVVFTAGSPATRIDLWVDGSSAATSITSPHTYLPGNNSPHSYVVRTYNGVCYSDSGSIVAVDAGCAVPSQTSYISEMPIADKSGFTWADLANTDYDNYRVMRAVYADLATYSFACDGYGITSGTAGFTTLAGEDPSGVDGRCYYYIIQNYNCSDPDEYLGPAGDGVVNRTLVATMCDGD